jgi:epoxide hydrolase
MSETTTTSGNETRPFRIDIPQAEYWRTQYNWRAHEAQLNEFPQFITVIEDQDVHFVHVRSPQPGALPLIITHGWPGSVVEFMNIIGPLTDPASHGGDPADAFHVVAPSLPGFGFSRPLAGPGWDTRRVARAWAELMHRLGYDRYGAQGGDTGSVVSPSLAASTPSMSSARMSTTWAPSPPATRPN